MNTKKIPSIGGVGLMAGALALTVAGAANANIYVTNSGSDTVSEYDNSGTLLNSSFITGLNDPGTISASGSYLFVANNNTGTVGEYNAATGAAVNAALVTGLHVQSGTGIAVTASGDNLFIADNYDGTVGEYNAKTGAAINASLVSQNGPGFFAMAVSGNNLFVANVDDGVVGEYNASTGAAVNAALVTDSSPNGYYYGTLGNTSIGGSSATGVAVSGSDLFVANYESNTINEYALSSNTATYLSTINTYDPNGITISGSDIYAASYSGGAVNEFTTTGTAVAAATYTENGTPTSAPFISGLNGPTDLVVTPAPIPGSGFLAAVGGLALIGGLALRRRMAKLQ